MVHKCSFTSLPSIPIGKFSTLYEISQCLLATDNFNIFAGLVIELSTGHMGAERGSLMLTNKSSELYVFASKGFDPDTVRTQTIKTEESVSGIVAKGRDALLVQDITADVRFRASRSADYKSNSFVSCPITSKGKLIGILNSTDKSCGIPFTSEDLDFLKVAANMTAIAFEKTSLMNQVKITAHELEQIRKRLIESDFAKGGVLTRISHILRTPLNSIKGAIYYLQHSANLTRSDQVEFFNIISKETGQLVLAIENLLDFLRLQNDTGKSSDSIINISDLLMEILNLKLIETLLSRKQLRLKVDIKGSIPSITGEKIRIVQFFIHLIEVLAANLASGDTIRIDISDNGSVEVKLTIPKRLPEEVLPYLSDPGSVLQPGHADEGLKLYLARRIADVHKWNIKTAEEKDSFNFSIAIPKGACDTAVSDIHVLKPDGMSPELPPDS